VLKRILQLAAGVGLIPLCIGISIAFYEQLLAARRIEQPEVSLLLGITAYLAVHALLGPPRRAYVLGHELTHASATWVSGGQVKGFKAGAKQGAVITNKVTGFIALAPYMIPVYAVLAALAYGAAGLFYDVRPWIHWFLFGLGAALAFHLVFTVEALKQKQPDLEVLGPLLSVGLIYCVNLVCVIGVMALIVPEVRFGGFLQSGGRHAAHLYRALFSQIFLR